MSVFKAQPPQITFPAHQATVAVTGIGTVPFQWISRSTSPASVLGTIYDLKIYELPDEVTDPNVSVLSGLLPVFNTQTASTSYFYGPGDPLLQPGKRYAIVVQAQDIGGGDSYENQGLSQVVAFKVAGEPDATAQAACPAPTGLNIRQDDAQTLEVSWNPVAEATDYLLQFRKAKEPWQSQTTTDNGLMLIQLSPAKYEVQVATRCNGGLLSTISPMVNYEIGIASMDSTEDEIEDVLTYYNEDPETPEPEEYEEPAEPYKDPLDDLILTVTYTDTTGKELTYTSLPPNPTTEQLKQATVAIKPQCVALSSGYSCGIHDNPAAPIGAEYMPKAGDELAMGSTKMEVVKIDGSGNGMGIATVKAFNNAKFGVEFIGIKVKEGGCIYAGQAKTTSLDFALLSQTQREELEKYYAAYNTLLTAADSLAPEIAKGMNTLLDALKSKKAATRALLEENDLTKLPEILTSCTDIASQSQATQDSLQKLYCGLQAGTIKGYKKDDIKAAIDANIEFMNKLGPALADCQSTSFTPWEEKPCGGPCAFEFERYEVDNGCLKALMEVFLINSKTQTACFEKIKDQPDLVKLVKDAIVKDCPSNIDDELGKFEGSFGKFCDSHRFALMYCLSETPCVGDDEVFINKLIKTTPNSDVTAIKTALLKNGFLDRLITSIDGDNFDDFIKVLSEEPFSKKSTISQANTVLFNSDDGVKGEIANNGIIDISTRRSFGGYYQSFQIKPFDYVRVIFMEDFVYEGKAYRAGNTTLMPGIKLYGLYNQGERNKYKIVKSGVFDLALTAVGVGQIRTLRNLKGVYKAALIAKSTIDIGTGILGFALEAGLEDELSTTAEGKETLAYLAWFNIVYGTASLSYEGFAALYRNIDNILLSGKNISANLRSSLVKIKEKLEDFAKSKGWKINIIRKLLNNELQVGKFGDLSAANTAGKNGLTAHHIPSDAYMKKLIEKGTLKPSDYSRNDGLCILVESSPDAGNRILRHNRTKTFLSNMTKIERESYYALSLEEALKFDIEDLRNIYRQDGAYDATIENALQDLIKQTKNKYKNIFN